MGSSVLVGGDMVSDGVVGDSSLKFFFLGVTLSIGADVGNGLTGAYSPLCVMAKMIAIITSSAYMNSSITFAGDFFKASRSQRQARLSHLGKLHRFALAVLKYYMGSRLRQAIV